MLFRNKYIAVLVFSLIFSVGAQAQLKKWIKDANLFPVEQDVELGKQVKAEIEADPKKYPLLAEQGNEQIYTYIRGLTSKILNTGRVANKDKFVWEVKIINDDKTLNAFCTPGGYIYVYTGLIKFLDSEDQLIGVMGHEIAHAAQRHSTRQLTKIYGIQIMLELASNGRSSKNVKLMKDITTSLVGLKFSRGHETEADEKSVDYLCPTGYNAAGAAGFFKKIQNQGGAPPEFLSTHPSSATRVQDIEKRAKSLGCNGRSIAIDNYSKMKALLK